MRAVPAYFFGRVSDKKQRQKYGPDAQRHDAYVGSTKCPIPYSLSPDREAVITETASSWNRKRFGSEMRLRLEEFQRGEWGILVFPRVDRESRFLAGSFEYLLQALKAGIPIYFARDDLLLRQGDDDAFDIYEEKVRDARSYIKVLKANTAGGRFQAMEAGKIPTGWGPWGLAGYDWKDGRFQKNQANPTVEKILRLYLKDGESQSSITKALHGFPSQTGKIWWQSSVGKVLRHARWYAGILVYKGKEFRGLIDPIITEMEAELILKKLGRKPRPTAYGRAGWWTGRVTCGLCERRYAISKSHGCRCNGADSRLPEPCPGPQLGFDEFVSDVQEAIRRTLSDPVSIVEGAGRRHREWTDERATLQAELEQKQGILNEYASRKARISRQHELSKMSDQDMLDRFAVVELEERGFAERVNELRDLLDAEEPVTAAEVGMYFRCLLRATFPADYAQTVDKPDYRLEAMDKKLEALEGSVRHVKAEDKPDLNVYYRLVEPFYNWDLPKETKEAHGVLLQALDQSHTRRPTMDQIWTRLADRLNLHIVIYPTKEPGRKAEMRVIGEFNPATLVELSGTATVNTLSSSRVRRRRPGDGAD